ncbi:MAG TPA: hypothetical protein VGJ59_23765 [Jatrophihabitantaceae bacterium]
MVSQEVFVGSFVLRYRGVIAVVLLLAAVLFGGLYRVADGVEKHSYNSGAVPPDTVQLTQGRTYQISVPGGRKALAKRGISTSVAQCSVTLRSGVSQNLTVTPLSNDVRPTNALATFVAPVSGSVHLDCGPWGAVYVDDADNTGWDYAGLFLLLTAICLTLAVALGLSALYARHDDEVQRGVGAGAGDHEVAGPDGGDPLS